jgi:hypothetical protein
MGGFVRRLDKCLKVYNVEKIWHWKMFCAISHGFELLTRIL